jgi:hypothetical protein
MSKHFKSLFDKLSKKVSKVFNIEVVLEQVLKQEIDAKITKNCQLFKHYFNRHHKQAGERTRDVLAVFIYFLSPYG